MALRKADIAAELFTFAADFTFFHDTISCYSRFNTTTFYLFGQDVTCRVVCYTTMDMFEISSLAGIVIFLVILFASVSFHEMMHALTAYKLGDDLAHAHGRISLNPLRHIDPFLTIGLPAVMLLLGQAPILAAKPVPINTNRISGDEFGLAAVGLAGPASNLLLAALGAMVFRGVAPASGIADIVQLFIEVNIGLFVFNMMPIPPLDGSRLLYALAPRPVQAFMEQIEQMGIFITLMLLFLLLPVISPILIKANDILLGVLL
jgi:Zn-dependent protease